MLEHYLPNTTTTIIFFFSYCHNAFTTLYWCPVLNISEDIHRSIDHHSQYIGMDQRLLG